MQAPTKMGESASARSFCEVWFSGTLFPEERETLAKATVTVESKVLHEKESKTSSEGDSVALEDKEGGETSVALLDYGPGKSSDVMRSGISGLLGLSSEGT